MLKTFANINNNKLKQNKSFFGKAIRFDEIHTHKKQLNLDKMMKLVNKDVKKIKNKNKRLKRCPICQDSNLIFFVKKFLLQTVSAPKITIFPSSIIFLAVWTIFI